MSRFYKSELTVSIEASSRSRNLLGVLVSILVLLVLSTVIVTAIVLINPDVMAGGLEAQAARRPISLEEAFLHDLSPDSYSFTWATGTGAAQSDQLLIECNKNLVSVTLPSSQQVAPFNDPCALNANLSPPVAADNSTSQPSISVLVANQTLAGLLYQGYKFSPSKRYLLIYANRRRVFRHSATANYYILDTRTSQILQLDSKQLAARFQPVDSTTNPLNGDGAESPSARFQLVDWFSADAGSPDSLEGLVLIQDNDMYAIPSMRLDNGTLAQDAWRRLTYSGKPGELYNGHPDWLYEEEVLGSADSAYQVSPQASSLAFMSFNDSLVELMPYSLYGDYHRLIPQVEQIRYPKTGRMNPVVTVHVVEAFASTPPTKPRTIKVSLPQQLLAQQHYISRIKWLTEDHLSLVWLNRNQNQSHLLVCSRPNNWACGSHYELSSPNGWLDMTDDPFPLDDSSYLMLVPKFEGPQVGSFKHILRLYLDKPAASAHFVTSGQREVTSIDGVSSSHQLVYYTATPENEPGQRQVYAAPLGPRTSATSTAAPDHHCITCDLFPAQECLYNSIRMSPSSDLFVVYCEGPDVPRVQLRTTPAPNQSNSRLLWSMADNEELRRKLAETLWTPSTMRLRVPIGGTNYSAHVLLLLPPPLAARTGPGARIRASAAESPVIQAVQVNAVPAVAATISGADQQQASPQPQPQAQPRVRRNTVAAAAFRLPASHQNNQRPLHAHYTQETIGQYLAQNGGLQYPMVVNVYGGPGSQKVDYRFDINLGHYLTTNRNTIYAMIDGRGSAYEGTNRMYELYHRFGTVEIQDQIDVATYLAHNLSFVDPHRVAIWGWSYGGYAAAMALAKSNESHLKASKPPATSANQKLPPAATPAAGSKGIFECAASVAPVTDWIYYDTAYTERYMSSPYSNEHYDFQSGGDHNLTSTGVELPQPHQNLRRSILTSTRSGNGPQESGSDGTTNKWSGFDSSDSYNSTSSSPLSLYKQTTHSRHRRRTSTSKSEWPLTDTNERYRKASLTDSSRNINKKRYLLIHGTADDNVHFQQSIMLMKKLISQNIMFETRIYPDQNHGISSRPDRIHLGTTLATFFAECFDMV